MKIYSQSILPELEGWEDRLALALQSVEANRTIGRLLEKGGNFSRAKRRRTKIQFDADFWYRVSVLSPNECWLWMGYRDAHGYGRAYDEKRNLWAANKLASTFRYPTYRGDSLHACHHCDNPPCCNPHHLFIGDFRDNINDFLAKGNVHHGVKIKNSLLTAEAVREIRQIYPSVKGTLGWRKVLSERYGVCVDVISNVVHGRSWTKTQ